MSSYRLSPMKLEEPNFCIYTLNEAKSSPVSGLDSIQQPHVSECMHHVAGSEAVRDRIRSSHASYYLMANLLELCKPTITDHAVQQNPS